MKTSTNQVERKNIVETLAWIYNLLQEMSMLFVAAQ